MDKRLIALKREIEKAKGDIHWLSGPVGKRILVKALGISIDYRDLSRVFGLSIRRLEYATALHRIRKPRMSTGTRMRWSWPAELLNVVRRYFVKSRQLKSKLESAALTNEMVRSVNEARIRAGYPPTNINAIRCITTGLRRSGKDFPQWGWSPYPGTPENRDAILAEAVKELDSFTTREEAVALMGSLVKRLRLREATIRRHLQKLELRWHYQPHRVKPLPEEISTYKPAMWRP